MKEFTMKTSLDINTISSLSPPPFLYKANKRYFEDFQLKKNSTSLVGVKCCLKSTMEMKGKKEIFQNSHKRI